MTEIDDCSKRHHIYAFNCCSSYMQQQMNAHVGDVITQEAHYNKQHAHMHTNAENIQVIIM